MIRTWLLILLLPASASGQSLVDWNDFNSEVVERSLFDWVNHERSNLRLSRLHSNSVTTGAAHIQADFMALSGSRSAVPGGKLATIEGRIEASGGVGSGLNFTLAGGPKRNQSISYSRLVATLRQQLDASGKFRKMLKQPQLYYLGVVVRANPEKQKAYVAFVLTNMQLENNGAALVDRLAVPITKGKKGLKPYDKKECRTPLRMANLYRLHEGLEVRGDEVWLRTDDLRSVKRLLRDPADGFAVDIVQHAQYGCDTTNIIDHSKPHQGVLLKMVKSKKLLKTNLHQDRRAGKFEAPVGRLKSKDLPVLEQAHELNLIVVQNKHVCIALRPANTDGASQEVEPPISLLPDSATRTDPRRYKLTAESGTISFLIPFEQGKAKFSSKDIAPLLDALEEPKYKVGSVRIVAHSSLEGDSASNAALQEKRAQSIVKALEKYEKSTFATNVVTTDGWEIFQQQVADSGLTAYVGLSKSAARKKLREASGRGGMESILRAQRFARVTMEVTYDITDSEAFVIGRMKRLIRENDAAQALRMQRYAMQQIAAGVFSPEPFAGMEMPMAPIFLPLHLNKMYIEVHHLRGDTLDESLRNRINTIYRMDREDPLLIYNQIMISGLVIQEVTEPWVKALQGRVDYLRSGPMDEEVVDKLDLSLQFHIIEQLDTNGKVHPLVAAALDRIRNMHKLQASDWQSALKLARIFIRHGDPEYAAKVMQPYIGQRQTGEELYLYFLQMAAIFPRYQYAREFNAAIHKAMELAPEKFCRMLSGKGLTFQILEHPQVKSVYCNGCN